MADTLASNQHDAEWTQEAVLEALRRALTAWEVGGCDCCCPTVLDQALEAVEPAEWERIRRWGLEMATGAQWTLDEEAKASV